MIIENVNSYALGLAAELVVGREQAARIHAVYQFIDQAQNEAYQAGRAEGSAQTADAYDTGYLDGVKDARVNPERADKWVADIVAEAAEHALNGEYDPSNVRDSGDEQP